MEKDKVACAEQTRESILLKIKTANISLMQLQIERLSIEQDMLEAQIELEALNE